MILSSRKYENGIKIQAPRPLSLDEGETLILKNESQLPFFRNFSKLKLTLVLENLFAAGTYKEILCKIATPALAGANIKLSTKVTHIKSSSGTISISTDNGRTFKFNEVVVTTPLGWLKNNKHVFDPPIPPRFSDTIDAIGYGSLEKVR